MKYVFLTLVLLMLTSPAWATDDQKPPENTSDNTGVGQQAPPDTFDGGEIDNSADPGKPMRMPSSDALPYSDDEIQNNSPEGYKSPNMPIDKD